jgi:hypothetical protein
MPQRTQVSVLVPLAENLCGSSDRVGTILLPVLRIISGNRCNCGISRNGLPCLSLYSRIGPLNHLVDRGPYSNPCPVQSSYLLQRGRHFRHPRLSGYQRLSCEPYRVRHNARMPRLATRRAVLLSFVPPSYPLVVWLCPDLALPEPGVIVLLRFVVWRKPDDEDSRGVLSRRYPPWYTACMVTLPPRSLSAPGVTMCGIAREVWCLVGSQVFTPVYLTN